MAENKAAGFILGGQLCFIACCIFYLLWWRISYRPGVDVDREEGINGILLTITSLCGLAGIALSIKGSNTVSKAVRLRISGWQMLLAWGIMYLVLFAVTYMIFKRTVTTELLLITGWGAFEIYAINMLESLGRLSGKQPGILTGIIIAAFVISIILYILYYRMESMNAFYLAMVPLVTEALSMGAVLITSVIQK